MRISDYLLIMNDLVTNNSIDVMVFVLVSILFIVSYYNLILRKYGHRKRLPFITKFSAFVLYLVSMFLLTKVNFITFIILYFLVYIVLSKITLFDNEDLLVNVSKNSFDFEAVKFDDKDFLKKAFDIYKIVSYSWSDQDMYPSKEYLTDDLYSKYEAQLNSLYLKDQKNVMSNIEYVKGKIKEVKKGKDKDIVVAIIEVKCRDYLINTKFNKILKGHPSFLMDYIYELTFYRYKEKKKNNVCPHCGAILPKKSINTCSYCKKKVSWYDFKYIMCKKNLLRQSAKKD